MAIDPDDIISRPQKRKRPVFDPPRPKAASKSASVTKKTPKATKPPQSISSAKSKNKIRRPSAASLSASVSLDSNVSRLTSPTRVSSEDEEPDFILAEIEHEDPNAALSSGEASIPQDLIHRLLHHHFGDKDKMSINAGAREVVCKYVEIFVKEAITRSTYMREDTDNGDGGGGDGFLEVEDLEKCAPLLVLDF